MQIRCPHCQNAIEIVDGDFNAADTCPSCGSHLSFLDDTATRDATDLGQIAHFRLLDHVGRGKFGDVYRAQDTQLERIVAIKTPRMLDADAKRRSQFVREARAAARLRHPNIVAVHEVGMDDQLIYIASDFIEGATLAERLTVDRVSYRRAAELCIQVGNALYHAHEAGVIHRDLKPQNILMDSQGQLFVTDFGLAKQIGSEVTMTAEGVVLGTPAYMPPEQARGDAGNADQRSDVYSLGVILYEMLTHRRPFVGRSRRLLLDQIQHDDPPPLRRFDRKIPRDLETICLKALEKQPDRRYQTAREMAEDLQRHLDGKPVLARPIRRSERVWRWSRRNPALSASLVLAAVLGFILLSLAGLEIRNRLAPLRRVVLETEPAGANVVFILLDAEAGTPQPKLATRAGTSPVSAWVLPGDYLVVAAMDDGRFHEVYRHVPSKEEKVPLGAFRHQNWSLVGNRVVLPNVKIPPLSVTTGMARLPGAERFQMGAEHVQWAPPHDRSVPAFYMDATEFTNEEYRQLNGHLLDVDDCTPQPPADDEAVVCMTWHLAMEMAERLGKRLPSETEYEYAATRGGTERFPWGSQAEAPTDWKYGPVGVDHDDRVDLDPDVPIYGLYSNVAEWTVTQFADYPEIAGRGYSMSVNKQTLRVVRGGTASVIDRTANDTGWTDGPCSRLGMPKLHRKPGLGFRGIRSLQPRLQPEHFEAILDPKAGN